MTGFATDLCAWLAAHRTELDPYRHRAGGGLAAAVEHDRGLLRLLHDAGWSRWGWPEAAGGLGGPVALRAVLYDQLAAADVEIPEVFVILETLGPVLVEYAPHLAARHLPAYLAGDELWGQGFSEPEAGSDLAALRTKAVPTPTGFRLTGQKTWTTLGQFARYAAVLARTGTPESAHRGLSLLWVDLEADGVEVRPIRAANGRDEFAELFFDDVAVPPENVIGEVGRGLSLLMRNLPQERLSIAVTAVASAERAMEITLDYVKGRNAFGKPVGSFQANRFSLAEAATEVQVARVYVDRCLALQVDGDLTAEDAAGAKYWTTELQFKVIDLGLQLHGGYGYMEEYEIARMWRDARVQRIYGGTTEIMKEIVGRSLGL
jgi:acyl-CoA dehydrogenase